MTRKEKTEMSITGIEVQLVGTDGNAYALMGTVKRAMLEGGVDPSVIKACLDEAMSGDYNHLLSTLCKYVDVI